MQFFTYDCDAVFSEIIALSSRGKKQPGYTVTAVSGNNLMKEINERWDCQWEMIPNHFCVILNKTNFSEAKLLGFYGKISKNYNKIRCYCSIKEMPIVNM